MHRNKATSDYNTYMFLFLRNSKILFCLSGYFVCLFRFLMLLNTVYLEIFKQSTMKHWKSKYWAKKNNLTEFISTWQVPSSQRFQSIDRYVAPENPVNNLFVSKVGVQDFKQTSTHLYIDTYENINYIETFW